MAFFDDTDDEPTMEVEQTHVMKAGSTEREVHSPVQTEDINDFAREQGMSKIDVYDSDGNKLRQGDFPYEGDVHIREYNENA